MFRALQRVFLCVVVLGGSTTIVHAQTPIVGDAQEVKNDGKTCALVTVQCTVTIEAVIDAAQIDQLLEVQIGTVAQNGHYVEHSGGLDDQRHFAQRLGEANDTFAQRGVE